MSYVFYQNGGVSQTRVKHGVQEKGFIQTKGVLECWTMASRSEDLYDFMVYEIELCVVFLRSDSLILSHLWILGP